VYEQKKVTKNRLLFSVKNVTGILEFCRDESLGSEQTTISVMELQVSTNCYIAKACLKKTKDKEKEKMLLDNRQPFMNRVRY